MTDNSLFMFAGMAGQVGPYYSPAAYGSLSAASMAAAAAAAHQNTMSGLSAQAQVRVADNFTSSSSISSSTSSCSGAVRGAGRIRNKMYYVRRNEGETVTAVDAPHQEESYVGQTVLVLDNMFAVCLPDWFRVSRITFVSGSCSVAATFPLSQLIHLYDRRTNLLDKYIQYDNYVQRRPFEVILTIDAD